MGKRVVITKQKIKDREYRVTALFEDHQMLEVSCDDVTEDSLLGNIYIGKIRRIVEKIGAAFVEIAPGMMTYLPLEDAKEPLMVKQLRNGRLTEEDELVVQVVKEAVKTKDPTVSTQISLKGNALIFTTQDKKLGVSRKLEQSKRKYFHDLFTEKKDDRFGMIVRTNAEHYTDEQIFSEFHRMCETFENIREHYRHRTCFSCLYHAPSGYMAGVRDYLSLHLERITTDDPVIYEEVIKTFGEEAAIANVQILFYQDPALSLSALYGLHSKLEEALRDRVWLKSGAYLIIQPTEALTVIDVNSGRCIKSGRKDISLKVILEAAEEIARQLRLRNISGICVVDFINMDTNEAKEELAQALKQHLAKDSVPAVFIDFTALGLAEITRKKVKKPLWEQIAGGNV